MIVTEGIWPAAVVVNVGRPDITSDSDRQFWKLFHQLIEESPIPIKINEAYSFIKDIISKNEGYLGGGFKYEFAFENEDQKILFVKELQEIFPQEKWVYKL
jgi:hypothetical protein